MISYGFVARVSDVAPKPLVLLMFVSIMWRCIKLYTILQLVFRYEALFLISKDNIHVLNLVLKHGHIMIFKHWTYGHTTKYSNLGFWFSKLLHFSSTETWLWLDILLKIFLYINDPTVSSPTIRQFWISTWKTPLHG